MGYVLIGGILVPDSAKPAENFLCRFCGSRFATPDGLAKHCRVHMVRDEAEIRMLSLRERVPEFFASDLERQAYLQSPRGRAEYARKTGDRTVLE